MTPRTLTNDELATELDILAQAPETPAKLVPLLIEASARLTIKTALSALTEARDHLSEANADLTEVQQCLMRARARINFYIGGGR